MKLLTNENNSQTLKILVAGCLGKLDVPLEITAKEEEKSSKPTRLPILWLDTGIQIFSSNAATCLLLESSRMSSDHPDIHQWLEWESTKLQPIVSAYLNNLASGRKTEVPAELISLLKILDDNLEHHQFIFGTTITAADIAIWASLYPLTSEERLCAILPPRVSKWHVGLSTVPAFQEAVQKLSPKQDVEVWAKNSCQLPVHFANLSVTMPNSDDNLKREVANKKDGKCNATQTRSYPVLPESGKRNILITSALPYVNNVPHLGNIIGCVLSADVFARYCRGRGYNTLYISGTDEYGTATETKAIAEGLTPQQICDKYHEIHAQVYNWFNIDFDFFGRTSSKQHTEICQDVFLKLHKNGLTLTESMDQLLCQKCDRFLADRFVEGECPLCGYEDARGDQCDKCGRLVNATELIKPRCKLCQQPPVTRASTHFFLDLPKVEPLVRAWIADSSPGWTNNASVIAQTWIKDGLKPRCITRDLKWGIPVPLDGYRDKVFYVWFDAPLGYVSMTKCYTDKWEKWWKNPKEVEYFQFMAKDNVPFHSVMFPSTQLGSGDPFTIVNHIMATEYLNYEEGKFSKSRGVGVFGSDVQDTSISADVWRFYLLYVRPESQDSSFSWVDLMTKNNSELLNNLGNFINRALMFIEKNFNSVVSEVTMTPEDYELVENINSELKGYLEALEKTRLRDGLRHILSISRHGNQYMQTNQPWVLVKGSPIDKQRSGSVVGLCANIVCLIAAQLRPYMPATADLIQSQLNAPLDTAFRIPDNFQLLLPKGHIIGKPAPLFTKIESSHIESLRAKFAGDQQAQAERAVKSPKKSASVPANILLGQNLNDLQEAVAAQGELVRKLKAENKDKTIWQPEVNKLLELKKNLAEAQKNSPNPNTLEGTLPNNEAITAIEKEIAAQGELVRKLKSEIKDKSVWQPEVNKLLELKQKLIQAGGSAPPPQKSAVKKKK